MIISYSSTFRKKKFYQKASAFLCAIAAAFGKWNVLRPISLLDIKDVKPTPKEHDGRKERRRKRKVSSLTKTKSTCITCLWEIKPK